MRYVTTVVLLLLIEFIDELVFGGRETALPLIRDDLRLSYVEIGLLLTVPAMVANFVEPVIGVLGDVWNRRALVLGGGVVFSLALALIAVSPSFWLLLAASTLLFPASGAFVALAQASLMDAAPEDRERNMARWALAGSTANAVAPFCVAALVTVGAGWRTLFAALAVGSVAGLVAVWRLPHATPEREEGASVASGLADAVRAARRPEVWRWLALLECADLMLDVLFGFLALYYVDVVGASVQHAALAVAVWTLCGLPGDALLIPLLGRVDGLRYLRVSATLVLALFSAFLLTSNPIAKLALLGVVGFLNAGWYSILKARLYASLPERSGTVMSLHSVANLAGCLVPVALGGLAEAVGLAPVMWLLLAGPVALLVGLPRRVQSEERSP